MPQVDPAKVPLALNLDMKKSHPSGCPLVKNEDIINGAPPLNKGWKEPKVVGKSLLPVTPKTTMRSRLSTTTECGVS